LKKDITQVKTVNTNTKKERHKRDQSSLTNVRNEHKALSMTDKSQANATNLLTTNKQRAQADNIKSQNNVSLNMKMKIISDLTKEEKKTSRMVINNMMTKEETIMNDIHHLKTCVRQTNQALTDQVSVGKDRKKKVLREERIWPTRSLDRYMYIFVINLLPKIPMN
jgi:subtilase family serine protease